MITSLACLIGLVAPSVQAQETVYPFWNSNQVLPLRASGEQTALRFSYRFTQQKEKESENLTQRAVRLGEDYDLVTTKDTRILTDYRLCRVFIWKTTETDFANQSCYADPAFRPLELQNRFALVDLLSGAMGKDKQPTKLEARFWQEQELSVQLEDSSPLTTKVTSDGTEWLLGQQVVAKISKSGLVLNPKERQPFARFLARNLTLHPQVRRAIMDSGILPARIEVTRQAMAGETSKDIHVFANVELITGPYPLPANLTSDLYKKAQEETPSGRMWRSSLKAATGADNLNRPTLDALLEQMKSASARKSSLETTLLFLKITQVFGGEISANPTTFQKIRAAIVAVQSDIGAGDAEALWIANKLAGERGEGKEREDLARYLANASELDKLDFGTFRYLTFSNLENMTKDSEKWDPKIKQAMPERADRFRIHIAAQPWGSNAYFDFGNQIFGEYDPWEAWQIWDLGRAIDPDASDALMARIKRFEGNLRKQQPDSF